jgi:uncharacterized protein
VAIYFLDSSALLKRYVSEIGTNWVQSLCDPAASHRITIATIAGAEIVAAIARKPRAGGIGRADASLALSGFRADYAGDFDLIHITAAVIDDAMDLAEQHGLRGYDAVQLAAARAADIVARSIGTPIVLVSADLELNAAATAQGISVDDPNAHP